MQKKTFKTKNRYVKGFMTLSNVPNHKRKRIRTKITTPVKETKYNIKINFTELIYFIIFIIAILIYFL